MAALILPSSRIVRPADGYALNEDSVRQHGTKYLAFPGQVIRDSISGASLLNPGGLSSSASGRVLTFNGSQQGRAGIALPASPYTGLIVAARIRATSAQAGTPGAAFGVYDAVSQGGMGVGFDPSSNAGSALLTSAGAFLTARSAAGLNKWVTVFSQISGVGAGSGVAYIDGRPATAGQNSTYIGEARSPNNVAFGAQYRSAGFLRQFRGEIEWASLLYVTPADGGWQSLTDDLAARLYEENYPYNLLKPIERRIWVAAAGVGPSAVTGDLSATETGADAFAASGVVFVSGVLSATETGSDTAALAGTVLVQGTLAATEAGADTFAATGGSVVIATGTLAATEDGSDTLAAAGVMPISGSVSATETGSDTAALAGRVVVDGVLAVSETGADTAVFNGSSAVIATGALVVTEAGGDTATLTGMVLVQALLDATEQAGDTAEVAGQIYVRGALFATETGSDTAVIFSTAPPVSGAITRPARTQGSRPARIQTGSRATR